MTNPPPQPPTEPPGMPSTYSGQPRAVPPIGSPGSLQPPPVLDRGGRDIDLELLPRLVGGLLALVGLVASWFLLSVGGSDDGFLNNTMPTIGEVIDSLGQLLRNTESNGRGTSNFYASLGTTLWRFVVGLLIGAGFGLGLGFVSGLNPWLRGFLDPLASFFRMIPAPVFAFVPFFWGSSGNAVLVTSIAMMTFWTSAGAAAEATTNRRRGTGSVVIGMATAIRTSIVFAWWTAIATETLVARDGLGHLASRSFAILGLGDAVALLVVIGIVGMFFESLSRLGVHLARTRSTT